MSDYTEGVCEDGAAILYKGFHMPISVILERLNEHTMLTVKVRKLEAALEFYADPELYAPHPHGLAFDRRDNSFVARAALGPTS